MGSQFQQRVEHIREFRRAPAMKPLPFTFDLSSYHMRARRWTRARAGAAEAPTISPTPAAGAR